VEISATETVLNLKYVKIRVIKIDLSPKLKGIINGRNKKTDRIELKQNLN
jgi:hypothetical protein